MKTNFTKLVSIAVSLLFFTSVNAQYKETMNPKGLNVNLKKDYGLVDDHAKTDQSDKLIKAIIDVNKKGGGIINIPKGVYLFSGIGLLSNVHILIESGTVIQPNSGVVFNFSAEKSAADKNPKAFIENVSVRGVGGAFVVDYHTHKYKVKQRAVIASMVRNFLIQDMIVKDNYSVYCGITLSPSSEKVLDVKDWEVSRATNGTIRNISHYKASPGYGLVQCHGAQSILFENLYSEGGVTLRLEVGANNKNVGVYDLVAKNIINENGRCTLMFGPHSAKNGIVTVDGVLAISSTYAVTAGDGFVKAGAPDQTPGYFSSASSVKNVHAIYGKTAQVKGVSLPAYPSVDAYADYLKEFSDNKFFEGPSIGAVRFTSKSYRIKIDNVTMEGFPYNNEKLILSEEDVRNTNWGTEKKEWEKAHTSSEFKSDKGVAVNDYCAKAYPFVK